MTNDQTVIRQIVESERAAIQPAMKADDFFERFCAWQVLKNFDPSEQEIEEGQTGSGDDGGIDSIYVLLDGMLLDEPPEVASVRHNPDLELVVIQSKHSNSFPANAMNKLHSVVPLLVNLNATPQDNADLLNERVRERRDLFVQTYMALASKHPRFTVNFYLCACADETDVAANVLGWRAPISDACRRQFERATVAVNVWGAKSLLDAHGKRPPTDFMLQLEDSPISTTQGSYVALVPIGQLLDMLLTEEGTTRQYLFDSNVRDFYQRSQINDEIISSAKDLGDFDFWWLNNGLTIIVARITSAGKTLTIGNPQIVNGLQTSVALASVARELSEDTKAKKNVLVKFVKIEEGSEADKIIKATNSQNPMPPAGLRALDPFQRSIEQFLVGNGFYYERRRNFYRNQNRPARAIATVEYLGQAVMSILLRKPNDARARPSSLLKDEARYHQVFDDVRPLAVYLKCCEIAKHVDAFLAAHEDLDAAARTNCRFYVMMLAVDLLLGSTSLEREGLRDLRVEEFKEDLLEGCLSLVLEQLAALGVEKNISYERVAKGKDLVDAISTNVDALN